MNRPEFGDIVINRKAGELSRDRTGVLAHTAGRSGETGIFRAPDGLAWSADLRDEALEVVGTVLAGDWRQRLANARVEGLEIRTLRFPDE